MDGRIVLNATEQRRIIVLNHLASGALVNAEAAQLLGISKRQLQRLHRAYSAEGVPGLAHGNRGRPAHNAVEPAIATRVVELAREKYQGFNHQHLTEMLAEHEAISLSRPTVRRILLTAGISSPRRRRPPKHRRRRDRYPKEGMLLQLDASRHDWLEGRGPYLSLVDAIDDATGKVPWACFREQEDAQGYFTVMRETVVRFGIPMTAYADRHSIFYQGKDKYLARLSLEEQLAAQREPTQFGRLLDELGVELIHALSPQAKGRVERLWGTFQDRLASELRLAGAGNCEQANQVLRRFLPRHNRRFVVSAQDPETAWIEWPKGRSLDELFCFKYRRVVLNDNTVHIGQHIIDIPALGNGGLSLAHARVQVQERFDGTFAVYRDGRCIAKKVLVAPTTTYRIRSKSSAPLEEPSLHEPTASKAASTSPWRPPRNHPWRRSMVTNRLARAETR
jgi:transposase